MEHILDITTEIFKEIKEHERESFYIPRVIDGNPVKAGDTIKLYHPGEEVEALRIQVKEILCQEMTGLSAGDGKGDEEKLAGQFENDIKVSFALLEWMFLMETELDEWLEEERKMLEL